MILSGIELYGFKSFADRTRIRLDDGVSCFIGPNGCGKSNIVDAIKWALGEQRPSSLRGKEMADVIFKGNMQRGPCPHAEVSLVFRNGDVRPGRPRLPLDYEEVQITRRLHRSGESEYELNGSPCRLRDIRDLFLDTGVGVGAYSFMEQGRIDAILSANSLDRRALFEEAAGVSRYRVRRRETLRKLDRVEQDLLRAGDLIQELERQVRSLKNQAGRARSYKTATDRLDEIAARHSLHAYITLDTERQRVEKDKQRASDRAAASRAGLHEAEERVSEAEKTESVLTEALAKAKSELADLRARNEGAENRLEALARHREEIESDRQQFSQRRGELEGALSAKEAARAAQAGEADSLRATCDRLLAEVAAARDGEAAASERAGTLEKELEGLAARFDELGEASEKQRRELVDLQSEQRNLALSRARSIARQNELAGVIAELRSELSCLQRRLAERRETHNRVSADLARCREQRAGVERHARELQQEDDRLAATRLARSSRKDVLQGLVDKLEGVDEGVRVLLEAARDGEPGVTGVRGLLADLVAADMAHSRALEAALGELSQAIVVERCKDAIGALRYLKERKVGRVTLIPLEELVSGRAPRRGGARRLLDRVRFEPELWPFFEALLGDVDLAACVEALAGPRGNEGSSDEPASDRSGGRAGGGVAGRRVTLEGDLRELGGSFTGGGRESGQGLISRHSELEALEAEIRGLDATRAELASRRQRTDQEREALEQQERALGAEVAVLGETLDEERRRAASLLDRLDLLRDELRVTLLELVVLDGDRSEVRGRIREAETRLAALESDQATIEKRFEERRDERAAVIRERDAALETRRRLEIEHTRASEREAAARRRLTALEGSIAETRGDLERLERQLSEAGERLEQLDQEGEDLRARMREMNEERARLAQMMERKGATLDGVRCEMEAFRESIAQRRAEVEHAAEAVHEVDLHEQRVRLEIEALLERAREELDLDLSLAALDYEDDPETDWEALDAEIKVLRAKLARMGGVNLDAIEELEGVEERLTFMTSQRDDLVRSRRSLMQMIEEMDKESITRFQETFELVREHFRNIFRKLFHGGQADVQLAEGEDIMNAGVEIMVAPPGKRQQNITLLSGGERTMTAVALLFALFKTKPSPICVLDEVDAALDEINIERFCEMLDEFEEASQFLIVTHSKRTMARGRVLYGITMQGDGVSRPIAIDLREAVEQVDRATEGEAEAGMVA